MSSLSDKTLGDSGRESIYRSHLESNKTLPFDQPRGWHHSSVAREVAWRLCRELLSVSAAEIAAALDVAPSGWSLTVRRAHERMQNDAEFAHAVVELRERLGRYT